MDERQIMETEKPYMVENKPAKSGIGKRIGYFFLSLSPIAASLIAQIGIGVVYMILMGIISMVQYQAANPGVTQTELMRVYEEACANSASGMVFWYHLLSLPIFGLWYYFGCGRPKVKKSFQNVTVKAVVIAFLGGVALCLMSNGIVGIEYYLVPEIVEDAAEMMQTAGLGVALLANLAAVLLAPIGEEILCRGIVLHYAKKSLPRFWAANVLQAVLFGFLHLNWVQGVYAFFIGLMLGYLTERFHSLIPAMLLHFVVNFSSTVWVDKVLVFLPDTFPTYIILTAVTAVAVILLVWWGGSVRKENNQESS